MSDEIDQEALRIIAREKSIRVTPVPWVDGDHIYIFLLEADPNGAVRPKARFCGELNPQVAKGFHRHLGTLLDRYENAHGEISPIS